MNIIVIGNVVEGFKFFGPFLDINETEAQAILDEHPEGAWTELVSPPKATEPTPIFVVRKVNLENKWTVLRYDDDKCVGGDHHWLAQAYAMAAASVYRQYPSMHGALPSEVESLFENVFPPAKWPGRDAMLTSVSDGTVPSYLPKA